VEKSRAKEREEDCVQARIFLHPQIGQQPSLLQNIVLKGLDASTTAPVTRTVDDITTNIAKVSKSSADINVAGEQGFSATNAAVVK
jgi:hypothetical protein